MILILLTSSLNAQVITTIAGDGNYGSSGNGGPATAARFGWQIGVVTDKSGNIYIADHDNNMVRKINSAGIVTAYAGMGVLDYTGDGGPAAAATLYHPSRMCVDASDNLYVTDQNGEVIRKIDYQTGIITSITGFLPDGYTGDGGLLINARFGSLSGVSFDAAGNMYIADYSNHVIRKVNTAGIITTVVGNGTPGWSGDGGPANMAQLRNPYAVVFDNAGNMYIPDHGNSRIRKVTPAGIISTFAGTGILGYSGDGGPAIAANLRWPWVITIDQNDNLYIGDPGANVVRKVDQSGIITTYAGNGTYGNSGDGGPANQAELGEIAGICIDPANNLLISVREYFNVIRKVTNCLTANFTTHPTDKALCGAGNTSFSVTATNGTGYHWQVNTGSGWSDLSDNGVYSGSAGDILQVNATTGMNGYKYRCAVDNPCATIYSVPVSLTVNTPATPTVNISTPQTSICENSSVIFTATATDEGNTPVFQWRKNGTPAGTNNKEYSDNGLQNGDIITCDLTSNATCLTSNTAGSNNLSMQVTSNVAPSATLLASDNNICFGTGVTFTATPTHGGPTPIFTWYKNNVEVGDGSASYSNSALTNGDVIKCALHSSLSCIIANDVLAAPITMAVTTLATPSLSVNTPQPAACINEPIIFTAAPVNGGTSPVYEWKKNGMRVGTNNPVYSDATFQNGDRISCVMIPDLRCVALAQVTSNEVAVTIYPNPVVNLDPNNTLCAGSARILDAGNFTGYNWNTGASTRTISASQTGLYSVTVTDKHGCKANGSVNINTVLPVPTGFLAADDSICVYGEKTLVAPKGYTNLLWSSGSQTSTIKVTQPGKYWLQIQDNNGCTGKDTIAVYPKECLQGFFMPTAFTPNNDHKNDLLKPVLLGNIQHYQLTIYNRWGQMIFQSTDPSRGWDGTIKGLKQQTDTYIWTCLYQFLGQPAQSRKGALQLIR